MLDFVVSNNLALRIVDSQSHRRLIEHCNASVLLISKSKLIRDLDKTFLSAQSILKIELQEHIKFGGRISVTTDAWTASNNKEFIAVTAHWKNADWKQRSQLLEVVMKAEKAAKWEADKEKRKQYIERVHEGDF